MPSKPLKSCMTSESCHARRIQLDESCHARRIPQDKSCHARRIPLDEPRHARWLHRANPAMHDGSTGRILSRSMASIVQILPSRPGGSRWANPVGQSTFDGANGFHRRVRHCHFRECPLKKHPNNCGARLRGAQSAAAPVSWGPIRPDPQSQSDRGISALEPQYTAEPQPRNAKAASTPDIKAPRPFRHQGQGAQSVSAP